MSRTDNALDSLKDARDKAQKRADEAETENLEARYKGMVDAYQTALRIVRICDGDFDTL